MQANVSLVFGRMDAAPGILFGLHFKRRVFGWCGQLAERAGLRAAPTERGTPPAAIGFANAAWQFLLIKTVDRQHDNKDTDKQCDHCGQPQGFGFWLHRDALFFPRLGHNEFPNVAKFGHPFRNERIIATETLDCRQGPET